MPNELVSPNQTEGFFEVLIQSSTDIILIVGPDGRIRYVNPAVEAVLGYKPESVTGQRVFDFAHPDAVAGAQQIFEKAKNQPGTINGFGGLYRHANGSWVELETKVSNLLDHPNIQGILVNARDVTARKQAEEALRQSEMRYHSLVQQAADAIVITDLACNIREVNNSACQLLGYSHDELLQMKIYDLVCAEDVAAMHLITEELRRTGSVSYEARYCHKDSSSLTVDVSVSKVGTDTMQAILRNVTERKKNELELHRKAQEFSALVENSPDIISRLDLDLRYIYVNAAIEKASGLKPEAVIGTSVYDWESSADYFQELIARLKQTLETGEPQTIEVAYKLGDSVSWYDVRFVPEFAPDGSVSSILRIAHDITGLKKAEIALRESERGFRLLFADNPLPMWVYDRETLRFLEVNGTAISEYGYSREEFLSMTVADIRPPQDNPALINFIKQQDDGLVKAGYWRHLHKSGKVIDVEVTSHQIEFNGQKARLVAVRNITARKQVENVLAAERELLAVTLRSIGEGVIAVDTTGRIMLVNRQAETILACKQADVIGSLLSEVFYLANGEKQVSTLVVAPENANLTESYEDQTLIARDGTKRQVSLTRAPIYDHSGTLIGTVIAFQDVTEKQKLMEARLQASKLESLGLLAGGIAHDFNNLLAAAMTNLSLLRLPNLKPQEIENFLSDTERALLRSRDLTQQLLTFAKGGAPVKKTALLPEIIRESVDFTLRGSNVQAIWALPEDLWPAEVDRGQLSQVVQNLVINAAQAMPTGGTLYVRGQNVKVEAEANPPLTPGNYVKISVQDEGVGIAPENLSKIFDPYFTTRSHGTGLGLTTSYSIIKRHDGYITLQSELGKGTTVEFYLPTSTKSVSRETTTTSKVVESKGRGRLLIMDDEASIRNATSRLLNRMGYEVEVASDGNEALERYKEAQTANNPFSVVIMDLTIPGGMGGKEAIKHLLEIDPQAKAIVSSGYSNDAVIANYQEYGFKGILVKPFRLEDLTKVVEQVVLQVEPSAQLTAES